MLKIKMYTIVEVAEILDVTPRTIQRYITDKKIPAMKIGRKWRIKEEDLKAFLGMK